jgi:hypothetical protein
MAGRDLGGRRGRGDSIEDGGDEREPREQICIIRVDYFTNNAWFHLFCLVHVSYGYDDDDVNTPNRRHQLRQTYC